MKSPRSGLCHRLPLEPHSWHTVTSAKLILFKEYLPYNPHLSFKILKKDAKEIRNKWWNKSASSKGYYWELPIKYDGSPCLWFDPLLMSVGYKKNRHVSSRSVTSNSQFPLRLGDRLLKLDGKLNWTHKHWRFFNTDSSGRTMRLPASDRDDIDDDFQPLWGWFSRQRSQTDLQTPYVYSKSFCVEMKPDSGSVEPVENHSFLTIFVDNLGDLKMCALAKPSQVTQTSAIYEPGWKERWGKCEQINLFE